MFFRPRGILYSSIPEALFVHAELCSITQDAYIKENSYTSYTLAALKGHFSYFPPYSPPPPPPPQTFLLQILSL